jgi:hypothetical protein
VFAPDRVKVLVVEVPFVTAPEPEMMPDRVWSVDEE